MSGLVVPTTISTAAASATATVRRDTQRVNWSPTAWGVLPASPPKGGPEAEKEAGQKRRPPPPTKATPLTENRGPHSQKGWPPGTEGPIVPTGAIWNWEEVPSRSKGYTGRENPSRIEGFTGRENPSRIEGFTGSELPSRYEGITARWWLHRN